MVNPTGYTALDLIGFTDKGAYSSSDNYVKNDLVHYSGNIWRCLIDDTSGIAPAEGVNWTLFIGEPTNLVERIIAPVETDPATNAWAVGRQIIYNDNLYEVIAAITAGDALVAYEDDPTNANIKLADPVETQVLALNTQIQTKSTVTFLDFTASSDGVKTISEVLNDLYGQLATYINNHTEGVLFLGSIRSLNLGINCPVSIKSGIILGGFAFGGVILKSGHVTIHAGQCRQSGSSLYELVNGTETNLSSEIASAPIVGRCFFVS